MNYDNINIDQGRQGMVVTPTFNEVTGEYGDFEVANNGILQNEQKYQDYQANNDTVNPDAFESQESIDDQLVDAFTDANPDTFKAISYAKQFMSDEQMAEWNNRVDKADWFDLAEDLEQMLQQYRAAGSPDIEDNVYEEEPEITQADVEKEFQSLMESEPAGIEQAGELLSEAESCLEQGDELSAQILFAASRFHSGSMSAEDAIQSVMTSGYSEQDIINTYYTLFE